MTGLSRHFAEAHATIGYVLTPSFTRHVPIVDPPAHRVSLRTNNLGLRRDQDTQVDKPDGLRRLLVLGDSQSEGIVDNRDTFSARLERRLGGSASVEVLNAATSGYSPLLALLWWREYGVQLSPDMLLLALYSGNDIGELLMRHEDFGGYGPTFSIPFLEASAEGFRMALPGSESGAPGRIDYVLRSRLRSYALLRRALRRRSSPVAPELAAVAAECPGCLQSLWQEWLLTTQPSALEDGFARLRYVLDELQRDADHHGVKLVLAVIPTRSQVEPESSPAAVQNARARLRLPTDVPPLDEQVHRRLVEEGTRRRLPTIDLLPPLREAHRRRGVPLYWSFDWHLNPEGHAAIAEEIAPLARQWLRGHSLD